MTHRRAATVSAATPTLDLFPELADVELPFGEAEEEAADRPSVSALDLVDSLRDALADVLTALEDPRVTVPANRLRSYRVLVGRPAVVDQPATPEQRRDEGIARAAARWTAEEEAAVDAAIATVARRKARAFAEAVTTQAPGSWDDRREFTTADVWAELGVDFPVTKGIAGRMTAAKGAGLIANAGRTIIAPKDATGPNHGQRLTVWRAL